MDKSLKYALSADEVNFILGVLNKAQTSGIESAKALISTVAKLQAPLNKDEIDKEAYEELKARFETAPDKKK